MAAITTEHYQSFYNAAPSSHRKSAAAADPKVRQIVLDETLAADSSLQQMLMQADFGRDLDYWERCTRFRQHYLMRCIDVWSCYEKEPPKGCNGACCLATICSVFRCVTACVCCAPSDVAAVSMACCSNPPDMTMEG